MVLLVKENMVTFGGCIFMLALIIRKHEG